ncbi:hypothetical protein DFQ28_000062 [Apophysomyces sp. BC1034]|nr:hypothetical protein DFQ29_005691 [Apophysomyces sp. BC1021]KAG0194364.1 hypothetical protein DFQ28_000062 [Apophysomyces sp. BC1034]
MRPDPDTNWYWSPFAATWAFSIIIAYYMYRSSCDYVNMRQQFFRHPANQTSAKSLLISNVPEAMRSDEKIKKWLETKSLPFPIQEAMIGHHSDKLTKLTKEHEEAVHSLEDTLSSYLNDGKTVKEKRPTVRVGGLFGLGGKKTDAIDYYTKMVNDTETEINNLRRVNTKTANYGWVSFERIEWAHKTNRALARQIHVRHSPTPQDLIWSNLPLNDKARQAKRWMGRGLYWVFVFAWMAPLGALSATSNIVNLIRFIPDGDVFIDNHQFLMGFLQSYFTPIVMAVFFLVLPYIFRFLSQMQGYRTQTTLDRKVLLKLYTFFIINNFLLFTLASILFRLYGQASALINNGALPSDESLSGYLMQMATNISDVSSFWINYVCIKGLGITMDLAQIMPLLMITLRKLITRPSPRKLRELAQPTVFDYPQNYNLLLFFFTIALVYSAIAPLVLPFALVYFVVATMVYKYLLMYINVTKIESGGKMWPVLFQTVMSSVILFQVIMIVVLKLKGGLLQSYLLIPLPFFTLAYQYFYYRRLHVLGSFLIGSGDSLPVLPKKPKDDLSHQFRDPALHSKLSTPMVHDDVKHLLSRVYHRDGQQHHLPGTEVIEMAQQFGKRLRNELDLNEDKGLCKTPDQQRLTVLGLDNGQQLKFCSVTENEVEQPDKESDQGDDSSSSSRAQPQALLRQHTKQSDIDDDRRGLVQDNHAERYWQQSHDGYVSSPSIEHPGFVMDLGSEKLAVDDDEMYALLSQPPALRSHSQVENGQPLLDVAGISALVAGSGGAAAAVARLREPGQQRNITSEYIEMYESWTPQQQAAFDSRTSRLLGEEEPDMRTLSLQEFGSLLSPMNRRRSAPMLREYVAAADGGNEQDIVTSVSRAQSMPDLKTFAAQQQSTHLKRHPSAPTGMHRKQPRYVPRSSLAAIDAGPSLQRSRTMPARRSHHVHPAAAGALDLEGNEVEGQRGEKTAVRTSQPMLRRNSWAERNNPFSDEYHEPDSRRKSGSSSVRRSRTMPSWHGRPDSQGYRITYYEDPQNHCFASPSLLDLPQRRLSSSSSLEYFRRQYLNPQQDRVSAPSDGQWRS